MSERKQQYFSTGEFAALCGTTKDTLFHYDQIGILTPRRDAQNRYRQYTSEHFFVYDLICVLRQAGSSLEEIGAYLKQHDPSCFLTLLREKRLQIAEQVRQLEQMDQMLQHTIQTTETALQETYDLPKIEWQEEETLLLVQLQEGEGDSMDHVAVRLAEHFARCAKYHLADRFPLGSIISEQAVRAGSSVESHLFSRVPADFPEAALHVKPAGTYATIFYRGTFDTFDEGYSSLLKFVKTRNCEICGNAYVNDLLSYLASGSEEAYVFRISVQVKMLEP